MHQAEQILNDRYQIINILGQGGIATTYAAKDIETDVTVAIKVMSLRRAQDWKAIELFEREAKILSQLNHPAIPQYLDYFQIDTERDREFYIVQSLAPGTPLSTLIERGWEPEVKEVEYIAAKVLEILNYLHRLNPPVIHRDIKPQNLIKSIDGKISLVDFGAVQDTYHQTVTGGSTVVGTYGYMAPEQFRGQAVPATDLYGLGATILHLLTHRSPAEIPQDGLRLNFRDRLQVSSSFADWLERMLEPDVGSRFSSSTKALEVLKNPPKSKKIKATFSKFDRALIGAIGLASLVLVFGVFDRSKYYWLSMAGLVATEPFEAMSYNPTVGKIQAYLDRGFNIGTKDRNARTLLDHAIQNDLPEVVKLLIERGADTSDSANILPLEEDAIAQIKQLKQELKVGEGNNFLANAQSRRDTQMLINRKESELPKTHLNSIVYYAVRKNRISVLELAIQRGISIEGSYPDKNKFSLLHLASIHQDGEIVKLLLDRGIDPNIKDDLSCTPLHTAIVRDLMPYTPRLSNHIANISNSSISKQAIFHLVQAGAKADAKCYFNRGEYQNNFYYPGSKIDSVAKLIGSKTSNSSNSYDYSSPAQLLLFLGIIDISLNPANQIK